MDRDTVIVMLNLKKRNKIVDLEIPLNISANELVIALNEAYELGINTKNLKECYLKLENPIAFLKGNKTLAEYGIRDGSIINFTD